LLFGASLFVLSTVSALAADPLTKEVIARSQVSSGNIGRLVRVFAKARRGEPITLGVIGGSITAGGISSDPQKSYAGLLLAWWRKKFPGCEIRMINAGLGGTGSIYGALRANKDLLSEQPDFVIVEFAVNDNWTDGEAFEGLVRQILAQPNSPAALLLFMMWERGGNDQTMQAKIGVHYDLPMVSFRDAIWPEMAAGRLRWSDYIVDTVHPNDAGHAIAARLVTAMLDKALDVDASASSTIGALAAPLNKDAFQFVRWRESADLHPTRNQNWDLTPDESGHAVWRPTGTPGSISFDWAGRGLVAVFTRSPDDLHPVRFSIDGGAFQSLDSSTQPRRRVVILAQDLAPGHHTVRIERVYNDDTGKAAADEMRLVGLGGIGVLQSQNQRLGDKSAG
jgi:lysophospholipase L1-like esterase